MSLRRGGQLADEPDWPEHEARAADLAEAVRPFGARFEMYPGDHAVAVGEWLEAARSSSPDVARSLVLLLIRRAAQEGGWSHDTVARVRGLSKLRFRLAAAEAAYVLRAAAGLPDTWSASSVLACACAMAARAADQDDPDLALALTAMTESVRDREYVTARDRDKIVRALSRLAPRPRRSAAVDTSAITPADGWSAVVLPELADWDGAAHPVNLLIRHLKSATGSKPSSSWLTEASGLLQPPEARRFLRLLLEAAASADGIPVPDRYRWGTANLIVSWHNADLLRAAAWAASSAPEEWVVPALRAVAERGRHGTGYVESAKVPYACMTGLGLIASEEAIEILRHLVRSASEPAFRKQASAALALAARRAGLSPGELAELAVPVAGLDGQGERIVEAGTVRAKVQIASDGGVSVTWRGKRGWIRRPPAADAAGLRVVRAAAAEVEQALAAERRRLDGLFAQDRRWNIARWRELYCDHPVTRTFSYALVWVIELSDGDCLVGLPAGDGKLTTLGGAEDLPTTATVRLWHPLEAGTEEVSAWRDLVVASAVRQPVRQAFRETYRQTTAELKSVYSDRFAGQIMRYQQFHALLSERGWVAGYLGPYDGGEAGLASRDFPDAGLTAALEHRAVGMEPADLRVDLCAAGRMYFHRTGNRARTPVRLGKVPGYVVSEAMRDVDLVLCAASACGEPQRADHRDSPQAGYLARHCLGELGPVASMRREALTRLLPQLKLPGRLELTDRYLRVRGKLRTYKIHLGSGSILAEPGEDRLSVAPPPAATVALPFDDDMLDAIVRLAVFLAADDKISDPAILAPFPPASA